jgi:hypothetical protein
MKIRSKHLRLLPKPLAKCEPAAYPPLPADGVTINRAGSLWRMRQVRGGRIFETWLTRSELIELRRQATDELARSPR